MYSPLSSRKNQICDSKYEIMEIVKDQGPNKIFTITRDYKEQGQQLKTSYSKLTNEGLKFVDAGDDNLIKGGEMRLNKTNDKG